MLQVIYKISAEDGLHCSLQIRHLELDIVMAHDQTCGVASRYIGENVVLLHDVSTHANELNLFVAILSLDQEKSFDRFDWSLPFAYPFVNGLQPLSY